MTAKTFALVVICLAWALHRYVRIPRSLEWRPSPPSDSATMKAVLYTEHGDTSVLRVHQDAPQPQLQPHQILVHVYASSINPCDYKYRRNEVPSWVVPKPKIPGADVAGVVVAVGSGVDVERVRPFRVGDRVAAMLPLLHSRWGAAASYVAVDANLVAHVGPRVSLRDAAALPLVALTTLQALESVTVSQSPTEAPRKRTILVQAGAGGVGSFAIQYAKHVLQMRVIATASSEKAEFLRSIGCDQVVDYRNEPFEEVVHNVDVVLDPVSWLYEDRTLASEVLRPGGHYLNIVGSDWAFSGTEQGNGPRSLWNWIKAKTFGPFKYSFVVVEPNGIQLQAVMDLLESATIRAVVDRTFALDDVREAYEYLEKGHATGKVVLVHEKEEVESGSATVAEES
jgi:alcohol dehydrogenase